MNNKIAELVAAEMAEYFDGAYHDSACARDQLARFAERIVRDIVRECAGLVQGVHTDTMGYHSADQKIKEHFGVSDD